MCCLNPVIGRVSTGDEGVGGVAELAVTVTVVVAVAVVAVADSLDGQWQ